MTVTRLKAAWSGWPGRVLRLALAVLPLLWLIRFVDLHRVVSSASALGAGYWTLSLLASLLGIAIGATRWWLLLRSYGATRPPSVLALFRHYLVSCYYNLLPSGLAGDVSRGYRVHECLESMTASYTVILVDRVAGFIGLLGIAVLAMALGPPLPESAILRALDLGAAGAFLVALVFLALPYQLGRNERWRAAASRLPLVGALLVRIPPARSLGGVAGAVGLSVLTQGSGTLAVFVVAHAVSRQATLLASARVIPFIFLLSYIPLTPAGVGQREMLFAYFFGFVGVPTEEAVAIGLLCFSVALAVAALGGICYLMERALGWGRVSAPGKEGQPD